MTSNPQEARDDLIAYAATTRTVTADGLAPLLDAYRDALLAAAPAAASSSVVGQATRDRIAEAPADRAALRDRIRRAVCEAEGFAWDSDMLEPDEYGEIADMVLAVLPPAASTAWQDQADLRAENARLLRLHREDGDALAAMRARIVEFERPAIEAKRNEIRSSYTELIAQAEQDRDHESKFDLQCRLREREARWAREDAPADPSRLVDEAQQSAVGARQPDTQTPCAPAPMHAYRVSEIRDNVVRSVHGYHASLQGAFDYCETQERTPSIIPSAYFELMPAPGGEQWMVLAYAGPDDPCPETSDLVIRRVTITPDPSAVPGRSAATDTHEETQPIVAYVLAANTDLHCLRCTPAQRGDIWTSVAADELDDGGLCAKCGVDVLIPQDGAEQ